MESPTQIILVSRTAELKIRFAHVLDVTNKKIALSSIQYPHVELEKQRRMKRLVKDTYAIGEILTAFMTCDEVKENAIMNEINSSNASLPFRCLDMIQLQPYREHNLLEIESPLYHEFSANRLLGLTLSLCDLNGDKISFDRGGYIMVKLLIK